MKTKTSLGIMTLATLMSSGAFAQSDSTPADQSNSAAWYMGANIGQSRAKIADDSIVNALSADGFAAQITNNTDRGIGYKIYGGYQFNDYLAIEGGFFDLGHFNYTATTQPPATVNGHIKLDGANLDLLGFIPISDNFSIFGRVGMNYSLARDNFSASGLLRIPNANPSKHDLNYKVGLGLQYRFSQALAMRLEAERYRVDDAIGNKGDIDLISIGLVYRFGQNTQMHAAPVVAQPAPAPVVEPVAVVAPPPPPPPVPKPMPVKVSFSADSLFDFDKADIKPAGKQIIDAFSSKLNGTSFDHITVTGHTDRIGAHAYNLKLSEHRAENVKAYLIQSAGIASEKISAVGVDGDDPVTKPEDCRGTKKTKALIQCLQPDRRVDLEVTGTVTPR